MKTEIVHNLQIQNNLISLYNAAVSCPEGFILYGNLLLETFCSSVEEKPESRQRTSLIADIYICMFETKPEGRFSLCHNSPRNHFPSHSLGLPLLRHIQKSSAQPPGFFIEFDQQTVFASTSYYSLFFFIVRVSL